ncbi:MAG: hypothetical protein Q8P62_02600 [Candidatus Peregrinibacteria bacterium]|nr:hypothetical protein [Candidatus Peregrinibacteria bacterium]
MDEVKKKSIWADGWFWLGVIFIMLAVMKGAKGELFQVVEQASDKEVMGAFIMDVVDVILGPFFIIIGILSVRKKNAALK